MADPAAVLAIYVEANTAQANTALAKTDAQLKGTAATAGKFGKSAKVGLAAVAIAAGVAAKSLYDIGSAFDDAYDTIRTKTGATGKELDKLEKNFKNVVSTVPATFGDAADAVAGVNQRLNLTGKPLERLSEQFLELSRITGTDLSTNVETVSKAFRDWEVSTKDQSKTLDGFFRLSQASGVAVSEIAESVQKFGSPLRQLGFSLDEAAAMFANFERAGVNTQTMVPGLKLAISNLTRPTDVLKASMEKLGISVGKPDVALRQVFSLMSDKGLSTVQKTGLAMDVFGKRAGADMAEAVRQGRFEVDNLIRVMDHGDETIRKAGKQTMDFSEQWQLFKNRVMVWLEPLATKVFGGLATAMKEINRVMKGKGGFAGSISDAAESLKTFWEEAGAVRAIVQEMGAIIAKNVELMMDVFSGLTQVIRGVVKVISGLLTGNFGRMWDGIKDIFSGGAKVLVSILKDLTAPFRQVIGKLADVTITGLGKGWGWIKDSASKLFGWLTWPFKKAWDVIKNIPDKIIGVFKDVFDWIKDTWKGADGPLTAPFEKAWDFIKWINGELFDGLKKTFDWIKDHWNDLDFKAPFEGLAGFVSGVFSKVQSVIDSILGFIEDRVNNLIDAFNALPGPNIGHVGGAPSGPPAGPGGPRRQRGGLLAGAMAGDTIPLLGEGGEFMVNAKATKKFLPLLQAINAGVPRFQEGGIVGLNKVNSKIAGLDEKIGIADTLSTSPDSPGGTRVTTAERRGLIDLYKNLHGQLGGKRNILTDLLIQFGGKKARLEDLIGRGTDYIHYLKNRYYGNEIDKLLDRRSHASPKQRANIDKQLEKVKAERDRAIAPLQRKLEHQQSTEGDIESQIADFTSQLIDTQGVTGHGGRLFEVARTLADLGASQSRGTQIERLEAIFAQAQLTPGLSDDITWASKIVDYWAAELDRLRATKAPFGEITSAAGSLQSARDQLAQLQEQNTTPTRGTMLEKLQLGWDTAQLTPGLGDDLSWAQKLAGYWGLQLQARRKRKAPFNEISEAVTSLKQWQDTVTGLNTQMSTGRGGLLDRLQLGWDKAQMTPGLEDDLASASQMAFYWKVQVDKLTKAKAPFSDISNALSQQKSWQDQIASITEAMKPDPLPGRGELIDELQANLSLAGLTPDLADDVYWQSQIVDYWTAKLAELQNSGAPFTDISDAAQNLASARDALATLQQAPLPDPDPGPIVQDNSQELLALQAQLLGETQRKLNVSQAQMPVWAQFAGMFAKGGNIPAGMWGIAGESGPEVVSGPATVTPGEMGGDVHLHFAPGTEWLKDFLTVTVDKKIGSDISKARRT